MTVLGNFFEEVKKRPRITPEQEKEFAEKKEEAFLLLQEKLLEIPFTWKQIFILWNKIKKDNKSSNKLMEEYGNVKFQAQELKEKIDSNISQAQNLFEQNKFEQIPFFLSESGLAKSIYFDIAKKLDRKEINKYLDEFYFYRDKLVESNFLLVINYAKNFTIHGVPFEDLLQEGNLGLIRAAEKFDPSKGWRFSTYATWWIRQFFIGLVKSQSKTIRLPSHIHNSLTKIKKTIEEFEYEYNREPSPKELSYLTKIPIETIERLMEVRMDPISLEAFVQVNGVKAGRQKQLKDLIGDSIDYEKEIHSEINDHRVLDILDKVLEPEEKAVVCLKFGLDGPEMSFENISNLLDLRISTVKYIHNKALDKLRQNKVLQCI